MSDEKFLELAEENELARAEHQIAQVSKKAIPDGNLSPDQYLTHECEDCLVPLPEFRKQKGLKLCTGCQEAVERQGRRKTG